MTVQPLGPMQFSFGEITNAIDVTVVAEFEIEFYKPPYESIIL